MDSSDSESEMEVLEPSLDNIVKQKSLKWIFVGGKGGVGKTTTSCSLAVQLASSRRSVLLISTDPAHNLSDAFGQQFTKRETKVNGFDNLYAMEIDPEVEIGTDGDDSLLDQKASSFLAEMATSIPGIDEAMSFAELMKRVSTKEHEVIIFDTAPTGHTLRLLAFPSVLEKAFEKIDALRNRFGGMIKQVSTLFSSMNGSSLPSQDEMLKKFDNVKVVIKQVKKTFQDCNMTTFVCVCIPEFLSLYETERLVQELAKFGIDSHNIVINQVLVPEEGGNCSRCRSRVKMQRKYIEQFYDLYPDFHLKQMPLLDSEIRKIDNLRKFGRLLADSRTPKEIMASAEQSANTC